MLPLNLLGLPFTHLITLWTNAVGRLSHPSDKITSTQQQLENTSSFRWQNIRQYLPGTAVNHLGVGLLAT